MSRAMKAPALVRYDLVSKFSGKFGLTERRHINRKENGNYVLRSQAISIIEAKDKRIAELEGSVRFLLCFFEPDKNPHLDTNALKSAVAGAKYLIGEAA